jgi:hypothetical protein
VAVKELMTLYGVAWTGFDLLKEKYLMGSTAAWQHGIIGPCECATTLGVVRVYMRNEGSGREFETLERTVPSMCS